MLTEIPMSTTPPSFTQAEYIEPVPQPEINAPERPDPVLFWRAALFGIGGAIAGAVCYGLFIGLTHINIGYLAILVAYLIAKAMTMGSGGQGGRTYQISAVVLTYLAVVAANMVLVLWELSREKIHLAWTFKAIVWLVKMGIEYPFLDIQSSPFGGLIGLFILFIGMRAAWRMTSGVPGAVRHPFAR
jgi:hypothetical protein